MVKFPPRNRRSVADPSRRPATTYFKGNARVKALATRPVASVRPVVGPRNRWSDDRCRLGVHHAAATLAADDAALFFGEAAPDAGVLVGVERVVEALGAHRALAAHLPRPVDLRQRDTRRPYREEELGVGIAAERIVAPGIV